MRCRPEDSALGFLVATLRRKCQELAKYTLRPRPMTQADFARKIGISRVSVAHIETGRKSMSKEVFNRMCDQLDITCQGVKFDWRMHHMGDWAYIPIGARLIVTRRSTGNILVDGIVTRAGAGNIRLESDVTGGSTGNIGTGA